MPEPKKDTRKEHKRTRPIMTEEDAQALMNQVPKELRTGGGPGKIHEWREHMKAEHPEELAKIDRASLAKRRAKSRRHKEFRKILKYMLPRDVDSYERSQALKTLGLPDTFEFDMLLQAIRKCQDGDIEALKYVRDTIGEKPTESYNVNATTKPIGSLDLSQLSEEELAAIADEDVSSCYDDDIGVDADTGEDDFYGDD